MQIKQKIRIGLGLIFIVVLFFGVISIYFISRLSDSSKVILKNNYETLAFTREMRTLLDQNPLPLSSAAQAAFNAQLVKQEHNITEKGEREATGQVRQAFTVLQSAATPLPQQEAAERQARSALNTVEGLNMHAVVVKTDAAQSSVNNSVLILGAVCCFTFLLLFSFSVNISAFVADPLIKFREAFDEISSRNYDHRVGFSNSLEFEELTGGFNRMAALLKERDNDNSTEVLTEKQRIDAIIGHSENAIIITNEQNEIAFINQPAQDLFHLSGQKVTGKTAIQLTSSDHRLQHILEGTNRNTSYKFEAGGKEDTYALETIDVFVPKIGTIRSDELNIARIPAGKIYILRNIGEMHAV